MGSLRQQRENETGQHCDGLDLPSSSAPVCLCAMIHCGSAFGKALLRGQQVIQFFHTNYLWKICEPQEWSGGLFKGGINSTGSVLISSYMWFQLQLVLLKTTTHMSACILTSTTHPTETLRRARQVHEVEYKHSGRSPDCVFILFREQRTVSESFLQ